MNNFHYNSPTNPNMPPHNNRNRELYFLDTPLNNVQVEKKKDDNNTKKYQKKKKSLKFNFSFTFETLGKSSKSYFANFKVFLANETEYDVLTDHFLESQAILDCTNKYIDFTHNKKDIQISTKRDYFIFLRLFLLKVIETKEIELDDKYMKLSIEQLNIAYKNYGNVRDDFGIVSGTTINFSFPFESLGKQPKRNFSDFSDFLMREMQIKEIDDEFLESEMLFDSTKKYITYYFEKDVDLKIKRDNLNRIKNFFGKVLENDNIKLDPKFLNLSIKLIRTSLSKYFKYPQKPKIPKKPKKTIETQFSFTFESLGKYSKKNFSYFKNFIEKETEIEELDDSFLESPDLLECTQKFIDFNLNNHHVLVISREGYLNKLKTFLYKVLKTEEIKIDDTYIKMCITLLQNAKFVDSQTNPSFDKKKQTKKSVPIPNSNLSKKEKRITKLEKRNNL